MSAHVPADEFDPLAKLYRAERLLIAAGTRGEAVAEALHDVRKSIREIIQQRGEMQHRANYPRDYERER